MHISEGILNTPVLIGGAVFASAGLALGLKRMNPSEIPKVAMLASAFFIASLIHVPLGPTNVHLVLNGLLGILLGFGAIPAIVVSLLLQAVLFQFGGLTTLGINTVVMALPAVLVYLMFKRFICSKNIRVVMLSSFLSGAVAVMLAAVLLSLVLITNGDDFFQTALIALYIHLPIMIIEGFITMSIVSFLKKVKPEMITCKGNRK